MIKKKICVITGSRAEYGLLYWLINEIKSDQDLDLKLIVTGMHLSAKFGLTYVEIENEFKIEKKIDIKLSSDTCIGVANSMSIAQKLFLKTFLEIEPDIVVVLGDRYEIFSAAIAAMITKIPIAHIHGGEITEGSLDDCMRHCITKMSFLHFVASEEYYKRVIQLGECPSRVFNVGGLGVENVKKLKLLSRGDFEKSIKFKLNKKNILITFHPVTLENNTSKKSFQELLNAIECLSDTNIIFTKTNSDIDGKVINEMIDKFTKLNPKTSIGFKSLGHLRYLSALQFVDIVLGNSSSGLMEAPSFKIATINIGTRQKGRIRASSVIDCKPKKKYIKEAIERAYSKQFQKSLKNAKNPYDKGSSSKKIVNILKNFQIPKILTKEFFNIKF